MGLCVLGGGKGKEGSRKDIYTMFSMVTIYNLLLRLSQSHYIAHTALKSQYFLSILSLDCSIV